MLPAVVTGPVRPAEVWAAVEARGGDAMSYDAVASFLSFVAKTPDLPIERVRPGWYRLSANSRNGAGDATRPAGAIDVGG